MKNIRRILTCSLLAAVVWLPVNCPAAAQPSTLRVLFLGDSGPHQPAERFKQLQPVLTPRGIELVYTDNLRDITPAKLAGFDALAIYANITQLPAEHELAMLDFVAGGGGLVPIHCASFCFHNSAKYIELVGAQFQRHGAGVFKETIVNADHPVMKGLSAIESWDESYVHTKHNPNRVVLAERRDAEGAEPWTWVREHGQGRVFYTAWGHDQRTWSNEGFHALIENGIRWAAENSPTRLKPNSGLAAFEYMESPAPLPNYRAGAQWGTQDEPIRTMQKPLPPEQSLKHLVALPDFEVSLFAAEPEIIKPLWLAFDERGRLWIAESVDYPNELQPEGQGRDRLKIVEDTNGDGKADKFTIFADKLSVPTSFVFAEGGVIVTHSGRTELLKDTDGDDRADVRQVLFEGWGMNDTHATVSNLRYGFDNWIWGVVGYSGFNGEVGGKQIRFGQGIFRFKPDGSALEFIRSANNNTWGLDITEDNIIIGSTANGNASMYLPMPNRYYEAVNGWSAARLESIADSQRIYPITDKVRQVDWHGQYTAGSGSAIYTARSFPKAFWNSGQFVAEPTGHVLGLFFLDRRGGDFVAHNARSILASDDEWTSPIYAEVGPDGALWVVDWYNYIIQHNPVPRGFENGRGNAYETPLRDKEHGRIYRMTYRNGQPSTMAKLNATRSETLVAALKNDNKFWRTHAQRLLVERGQQEVVPQLAALVRDTSVDELGLNPAAIHALWTMEGLGALDGSNRQATEVATAGLKHPSAGVRRAAAMVLPRNEATLNAVLEAKLLDDADAQVRLAALLALAELPARDDAGAAVFSALQHPQNVQDRWIPDAATAAAAKNDAGFLKAVLASFQPATDQAATTTAPANLIRNSSFEQVTGERPNGWRPVTHNGSGQLTLADTGRSGTRSIRITSEDGGDLSWAVTARVQPNTDYRLTGWIKTQGLEKRGNALGALLNVHELQDPVGGATKPVTGDNDWTQVMLDFNSGQMTQVTINALFGGWGRAVGTAWFDDIELQPAPGAELKGEVGRVVRLVTTHYARRAPADSIVATLATLKGAAPGVATAVLDGLMNGWPANQAPSLSAADRETLTALMNDLPESTRDRLLGLAQRWGNAELFGANVAAIIEGLRAQVADDSLEPAKRIAAAGRWVTLDDSPATAGAILGEVDLLTPPNLANGLIAVLAESRATNTARALTDHWPKFTPTMRRAATTVLLRRSEWTMALLDAVQQDRIGQREIAIEHWSQLRQNPDRRVAGRANRLANAAVAISADRKEVVEKLLPLAKEKGDLARGKEVYEVSCLVCHKFNGEGGMVGPDLTGIHSRDRSDILLEILDPNRSVEDNYRLWNATLKDGTTYSGRLEAETQTTVEILDVAAQKHVLQRADIESLEVSQYSIMPTGFEALPEDDLKALVEYLAQPH